jgi:hypothetical protein
MSRLTTIILILTLLAGAVLGVWLALRESSVPANSDISGSELIVPNTAQIEDKDNDYADELELLYDDPYNDEDSYDYLEYDTDDPYDDPNYDPYDDPYYDEDS